MAGPETVGASRILSARIDLSRALGGRRLGQDQEQLVAAFLDVGLLFARERLG